MSSEMPELLPCPFCGGKAEFREWHYSGVGATGMEEPKWRIVCLACGADNTYAMDSQESAAFRWNRRADLARAQIRREVVEQILADLMPDAAPWTARIDLECWLERQEAKEVSGADYKLKINTEKLERQLRVIGAGFESLADFFEEAASNIRGMEDALDKIRAEQAEPAEQEANDE